MDRIQELLAILGDEAQVIALTDEQLAAMRDELRTLGLAVIAGEVENVEDPVALAGEIGDYFEGTEYVLASRVETAAALADALAAQAARFTPTEPETPDGDDGEGGEAVAPVVAEVAAPVLEPVAAAITTPEPAPVAPAVALAVTPPVALPALGDVKPPASHAPASVASQPKIMRMATREMVDFGDLVQDAIEKHESFLGMTGGVQEKVVLGRIKLDFPDDRNLSGVNAETVYGRLAHLLDNASDPGKWSEALVASGGFCAPAMPDYSIPQLSGTQRPVAGYLPTVNMDRGALVVITPPSLASVVSSTSTTAGSAVSVMTNANDIAVVTKPNQAPGCAATQTITLEAIVEQLQFGNSMARAFPELVSTWMQNTAAAWARRAESELLRQIDGFCLAQTTTQVLGASADFKGYLHQAAAAIRSRQRMVPNAKLRALVPAWFIDLVGADLAHMHAGDGLDRFTLDPEGFIRQVFASANVNPTFYQDTAASGATTTQIFGAATGGADLENFPPGPGVTSARMIWYLFPEGSFARGEGGTLDLGIVRDSTLNNTNDYRFFTESWEAVVPHVIDALKLTSTICATGQGAIDVTDTAYCTAS